MNYKELIASLDTTEQQIIQRGLLLKELMLLDRFSASTGGVYEDAILEGHINLPVSKKTGRNRFSLVLHPSAEEVRSDEVRNDKECVLAGV